MHLPYLLVALCALTSTTTAADPSTGIQTRITLRIPPSAAIPNPGTLPPSTHATLVSFHHSYRAPITTASTFVFSNISAGSYLADIHCPTYGFAPLRVDVSPVTINKDKAGNAKQLRIQAWETFRGNDWDNKGEAAVITEDGIVEAKVWGGKGYFLERSKFNLFSILKNPMILLGLVSMGIFIGMPYLIDNMDPEMRAEWEERQKSNPMNGIMGAATGQPVAGGSFDMAAFLAGSGKKDEGSPGPASGSGNGEGKRKKR